MILVTPQKAQLKLLENVRERRLHMKLTQEDLAERSGVALPTLRKFEQKGVISLESLLKLLMVVGGLQELVEATKVPNPQFSSIDDVLKDAPKLTPNRGPRS